MAGRNLGSRPATRDDPLEDATDEVVADADGHRPDRLGRVVGSYRKTLFLAKRREEVDHGRLFRHAKHANHANRTETDCVRLFRGRQIGHYGEDTNLIWTPDRDQAPAKGLDRGRALYTDGAPSAERPAKAAGTRGDAGGSTEAPCQRGSWRAGVARLPKRTGCPPAKAGFCIR